MKTITGMRAVRAATQMSQQQFAHLIGASISSVQKVELGVLGISHAMANRIASKTGVDPECLLFNSAPVGLDGKPYTRKTFADWGRGGRKVYALDLLQRIYKSKGKVDNILHAALEQGKIEVGLDYLQWVRDHGKR
jgi:transcriptional regulator with XRE-family HTH domain